MPTTTTALNSSKAPNFLNCAAPKHKIAQNCHLIRQIQSDLPPYPSHLGCYGYQSSSSANASPIKHKSNVNSNKQIHIEIPTILAPDKLKKHPGILKKYKSCPVSPVHEELDWTAVHDRSNQIKFNESSSNRTKRHTLYSDDAQTILDMIQTGTEKLIAEITQKYGDLDDYEPKASTSTSKFYEKANEEKNEHGFLSDEENFSSDSLEDCSLDLDCDEAHQQQHHNHNRKMKKSCKKHQKKFSGTPPKRSVSEYFIYEDYFTRVVDINRKVSLSDILNDDSDKRKNDQKFLETQRHSSASFFLGNYPSRKSQESILSDEQQQARSFCNSMESILSDESECKSAPLEILFEKGKLGQKNIGHIDSKSYGSSPNSTNFDYFMQNRYYAFQDEMKCDISNYGFDSLDGACGGGRAFKVLSTSTRSPTHHYHRPIATSFSVPQFTDDSLECFDFDINDVDFIPSMTSKVAQYNANLNKSLCKDFSRQQQQPKKPIIRSDIFADAAMSSATIVMKKSCSFEIDMGNGQRKIIKKNSKKFEQNLQRFEKDRRDQQEKKVKSDFNLEMDYVPHKPPVAHRRASSMKGRGKAKIKEKFNTVSCSQTTSSLSSYQQQPHQSSSRNNNSNTRDFINKDYHSNKMQKSQDEKSFEIYIAEKGICEDDNMDISTTSADRKKKKEIDDDESEFESQFSQYRFITMADLGKFRDIERKIDVINKLVELEEKKLEQERVRRENRVKPLFDGNTKERGFVKNLTKNFDMLAQSTHERVMCQQSSSGGMKRNYSLPDVLEGSMIKIFEFDDIDEPQKIPLNHTMKLYDFDDNFESADDVEEGVHHTSPCSHFFIWLFLFFRCTREFLY